MVVAVLSAWITARLSRDTTGLQINLVVGLLGASAAVVGSTMLGLAPHFGMIVLTGPFANLASAFAGAVTALAVRHAVARP
jgi:uncharacterized membrane protein YeaQ/YmgE (transglycosylase-associated protein family)